ncbi:VOC family protein [Acinetobacter indicus]|nr:VOC family protein [Acinetobacter indicus]
MKIYVTSLIVDDQEKALQFYTQILGFRLKQESRWVNIAG